MNANWTLGLLMAVAVLAFAPAAFALEGGGSCGCPSNGYYKSYFTGDDTATFCPISQGCVYSNEMDGTHNCYQNDGAFHYYDSSHSSQTVRPEIGGSIRYLQGGQNGNWASDRAAIYTGDF